MLYTLIMTNEPLIQLLQYQQQVMLALLHTRYCPCLHQALVNVRAELHTLTRVTVKQKLKQKTQ